MTMQVYLFLGGGTRAWFRKGGGVSKTQAGVSGYCQQDNTREKKWRGLTGTSIY